MIASVLRSICANFGYETIFTKRTNQMRSNALKNQKTKFKIKVPNEFYYAEILSVTWRVECVLLVIIYRIINVFLPFIRFFSVINSCVPFLYFFFFTQCRVLVRAKHTYIYIHFLGYSIFITFYLPSNRITFDLFVGKSECACVCLCDPWRLIPLPLIYFGFYFLDFLPLFFGYHLFIFLLSSSHLNLKIFTTIFTANFKEISAWTKIIFSK